MAADPWSVRTDSLLYGAYIATAYVIFAAPLSLAINAEVARVVAIAPLIFVAAAVLWWLLTRRKATVSGGLAARIGFLVPFATYCAAALVVTGVGAYLEDQTFAEWLDRMAAAFSLGRFSPWFQLVLLVLATFGLLFALASLGFRRWIVPAQAYDTVRPE